MEVGIVRQVDIDQQMQEAYLDYAMSVIVSRALPDVRDCRPLSGLVEDCGATVFGGDVSCRQRLGIRVFRSDGFSLSWSFPRSRAARTF